MTCHRETTCALFPQSGMASIRQPRSNATGPVRLGFFFALAGQQSNMPL